MSEFPTQKQEMTREKAIKEYVIPALMHTWNEKINKEVLETLEQEPTTKNDLGVDCISRDVVKNYIQAHIHEIITESGEDKNKHTNRVLRSLIHGVNCMPSVTPQTRKGHWITKPHVYGVTYCSECGFELKIDNTNYCPNCGAKMVEPQESEDKE